MAHAALCCKHALLHACMVASQLLRQRSPRGLHANIGGLYQPQQMVESVAAVKQAFKCFCFELPSAHIRGAQLAVGLHACGDLGQYAVAWRQNRQRIQERHMLTERQPAIGCRRRLRRKRGRGNASVGRDDATKGLLGAPSIHFRKVMSPQFMNR